MGEPLQTSHKNTKHQVRCVSPLTWPSLQRAPRPFCRLPFSPLPLSCSQVLPSSQTNPGCLSVLLSFFPLVGMPSSATEPKVCLLFLIGAVQTGVGLFLPLPLILSVPPLPGETDPDDRLGVDTAYCW